MCWDQFYRIVAEAAGAQPQLVHIPSDFIAACQPDEVGSLIGDKAVSVVFDNTRSSASCPATAPPCPSRKAFGGR